MPFIPLCCRIAEARTSSTVLNNIGEGGHPCRVLTLGGTLSVFFPIEDDIHGGSFVYGFYGLEV